MIMSQTDKLLESHSLTVITAFAEMTMILINYYEPDRNGR